MAYFANTNASTISESNYRIGLFLSNNLDTAGIRCSDWPPSVEFEMKVNLIDRLGVFEAIGPDRHDHYQILIEDCFVLLHSCNVIRIDEPNKREFNIKDLAILNPKKVTLEF